MTPTKIQDNLQQHQEEVGKIVVSCSIKLFWSKNHNVIQAIVKIRKREREKPMVYLNI